MIISVTVTDSRENEIGGAILSVAGHVDRVLVVDTGATDRTLERAKEAAGSKLAVVEHPWVDFSAVRNAGLEAAEALGAKWIVIVDSDERIDFGTKDLRGALARAREDVLFAESIDGTYPKEKLIRAERGVRFVGPTHEALIGGSRGVLRGAVFGELAKTDAQIRRKAERDAHLLAEHIEKCPNDPRWHHYLGMAYEGLERLEEAAAAYGRCVELRKTGIEAAWSAFKQAEVLCEIERYGAAVQAAARGIAADATSAECAWIAAHAELCRGRKEQAVAWARMSEAIGSYKGCAPERLYFRHPPALYELPYELLRIAAPNAVQRAEATRDFRAAKMARTSATRFGEDLDRLSVSRSIPETLRLDARDLLRPAPLREACPSVQAVKIKFEPPNGYLPTNPSICRHDGALWCVVRAVNYTMDGASYVVHDPNGVVRTENYLGQIKLDGTFVDPKLMRDFDTSPRVPSKVVGYEDMRLVSIARKLTGSATVCDFDAQGPRVARLHLTSKLDICEAEVQPSNQRCEKNWMPLDVDGEFAWIYSLDPTAILSKKGPLRRCPLALDHIRGGAAIAFGKGYLCVVHETIDEPEGRIYLHRFVKLDKGFNVTAITPAWVFAGHGIEFCAGLAREKSELVLSYGIKDREAWIMRVKAKEVEAMKWITP